MADQNRQIKLAAAKKKLKEFQQKTVPSTVSAGPKKKRKVKGGDQTDGPAGRRSPDNALYDHLMDFLADRGVDNTFADELMEMSTALEHQEYIKFLDELSAFVKCK